MEARRRTAPNTLRRFAVGGVTCTARKQVHCETRAGDDPADRMSAAGDDHGREFRRGGHYLSMGTHLLQRNVPDARAEP
jgi:hypothetical protein